MGWGTVMFDLGNVEHPNLITTLVLQTKRQPVFNSRVRIFILS